MIAGGGYLCGPLQKDQAVSKPENPDLPDQNSLVIRLQNG
jgi:hypothetical protein